jgi:hypothetical protein
LQNQNHLLEKDKQQEEGKKEEEKTRKTETHTPTRSLHLWG